MAPTFEGTPRFRLDRSLGRGGFGVVYRARDLKKDMDVALKVLSNIHAGSLLRFKQEFRSLADLRHPNLVTLYELLADADQWFFTMEMVEGVDFCRYVRGASGAVDDRSPTIATPTDDTVTGTAAAPGFRALASYDSRALRSALRQLTAGVHTLHAAGKLHRDLKPSNVLVTREGRVVILDFGLVTDVDEAGLAESRHLAGTPVYMSPEQSAGAPLTDASDWYAVGLMLFEVLTGRLPFRGPMHELMAHKQAWEPVASDFPVGTPGDLSAVCVDLLRLDPARRLRSEQILDRLADESPANRAAGPVTPRHRPIFIGRLPELGQLRESVAEIRAGNPATVFVHGSSGIGKTTLIRRFLDEVRTDVPDAVILQSRCYEQESVPYKALDGLVDALVRRLGEFSRLDLQRVLPREMAVLERLFPVFSELAADVVPLRPLATTDPWELRRRGGRALRELFTRLADFRPLILFIDDIQWGDVDSARLLQEILRPPEVPAMLLVLSYRSEEVDSSACVRELVAFSRSVQADTRLRELAVAEMSLEESEELAGRLAGSDRRAVEAAAQIAREGEGIPFFVRELVLHYREAPAEPNAYTIQSGGLDALVADRLSQLDDECRTLVELLAIAGRPLDWHVLRDASRLERHAEALDTLATRHLLRLRHSADVEEVELYHARMARGVLLRLPADARRVRHRQLAVALERQGRADAETMYWHYHEAGERSYAATFAVTAASEASKALAFNRAAEFYARALEDYPAETSSIHELRVSLADALAHAGRGEDAARAYLAAASEIAGPERLQLQQQAVGQLFRTGRFDEGLARLREILPALHLKWPETSRSAFLRLLARRLQLRLRGLSFQERQRASVPIDQLLRMDVCWSLSTGLSVVDNVRGTLFQTRCLLWALDSGEPVRICRAIALEAAFSSFGGSRTRHRTDALFRTADELAARLNMPDVDRFVMLSRGVALYCRGAFKESAETLTTAERLLAENSAGLVQELDNARVFAISSLAYLGQLRELQARLPALLADADERGDLYAQTMLSLRNSSVQLMADDPHAARQVADAAIGRWSRGGFHTQHYSALQRHLEIDLYVGDATAACARMDAAWVHLRRSLLLRYQMATVEMAHLRARIGLAVAAQGRDVGPMLKRASAAAGTLERQKVDWATALSAVVRAAIAATVGNRRHAAVLVERSEEWLSRADMMLHVAAARRRRGELIGGTEGQALIEDADLRMNAQGIVNPARFTAMLIPGAFQPHS
jgi:eukaryotic-like serine/threonine-protein kinase